jgi:hypothetical protein
LKVPRLEPLLVAGWAIDQESERPAAWIEIVLDDRPFRVDVRIPRGDVAAAHANPHYLRCGFKALLPATSVTAGAHVLAMRIVLQGGRAYYQSPDLELSARYRHCNANASFTPGHVSFLLGSAKPTYGQRAGL